jgi:uncharacterized protein YigE (DUF2233 family)
MSFMLGFSKTFVNCDILADSNVTSNVGVEDRNGDGVKSDGKVDFLLIEFTIMYFNVIMSFQYYVS